MRLKNVPGSREVIAESRFVIHNPEENKGKWAGVFGNDAPLHIGNREWARAGSSWIWQSCTRGELCGN